MMSGRVWQCEMIVEKQNRDVWTPCTVTLYRTKPRLLIETDPFSRGNHKILLQVNQSLIVRYRDPIAKDFTFYLENGAQRVTVAVFSEVEGNEVLLGLRRGGARLRPQKNEILFGRLESVDTASSRISSTPDISLRQPIQKNRKVKISRRRSASSWLRYQSPSPSPMRQEETAVWYFDKDGGDSESETIKNFEFEDDSVTDMSSTSSIYSYMSSSTSLPRLPRVEEPLNTGDVTDGSISSYFGTLPRATRKLFQSEYYLNKWDSNTKLDRVVLPDNWRDDDTFDPGVFGLLDNPGVLRMEFDDYPESVYSQPMDEEDGIEEMYDEEDVYMYMKKMYDEDNVRMRSSKPQSRSAENLLDRVNSSSDHFDYVWQRFEKETPSYEEALIQNGLLPLRNQDHIRVIKIEDPDDSDNSTLKLSDSDEETEV